MWLTIPSCACCRLLTVVWYTSWSIVMPYQVAIAWRSTTQKLCVMDPWLTICTRIPCVMTVIFCIFWTFFCCCIVSHSWLIYCQVKVFKCWRRRTIGTSVMSCHLFSFLCCRIVLFGTYWLDVKICTARMNACNYILGSYNISCCFENVSELG